MQRKTNATHLMLDGIEADGRAMPRGLASAPDVAPDPVNIYLNCDVSKHPVKLRKAPRERAVAVG